MRGGERRQRFNHRLGRYARQSLNKPALIVSLAGGALTRAFRKSARFLISAAPPYYPLQKVSCFPDLTGGQ
jgi:hypothetical protein